MNDLFGLIPLIFLLGLLSGLVWFLKARLANHKLVSYLHSPRTTYLLLIIWTIFGFLETLDYTQQWGCIISHEPIFSSANVIYTGTAIGLVSLGVFIPKKQVGTIILLSEILFWLYKLFFVKGGYIVGIGGVPSIEVLAFDTIALTLRLILIKQVSRFPLRTIWALTLVLIIMLIKIQFFRG